MEKRKTKSEKQELKDGGLSAVAFRFLFFAFLLSLPAFGHSASTEWRVNKQGRTRLIANVDVASASGTLWLGLEQEPAPGWHVYWKNAGDAGYAPRLRWTGSQGTDAPMLLWPAPTKFILPGDLVAYGYEGKIVYPIEVHVQPGAKTLRLVLDLDYLTCSDPCVPYRYTFTLDVPVSPQPQVDAEAQRLIDQFRAQVPAASFTDEEIQNHAPVKRLNASASTSGVSAGIVGMLLLAFLGGLLLNAMPCVLPVLSIKLLGLVQHAGQSRRVVARSAFASAAGILVSFLALGAAAMILKGAGHAVGWGTQFQNPYFVGILFVVVFLFGLNLWGLFEIPLPRFAGHFATSYGYHETLISHFFSGLFVTLLATPCSAPFLGTAMGFALAQSGAVILAIFAAAGLGMSVPYLALAIFPRSIHWLPRPGAWMKQLKFFLGALLMGTALWLGWVIVQQLHPASVKTPSAQTLPWIPFNEAVLTRDLAEGKTVFVDITADWCFTCKYNERVVLSAPAVAAAFRNQHIVLMQGDWTTRDAAIAHFLTQYGRAGIPFAGLYRPGKEPLLLPEFLTEKTVLRALNLT